MSTLKDKAEQILQEKEEKVIPENLPNSVTVYGVSGGVIDVRSLSNDISQEGAQLVKHIEASTGEEWYAAEVTGLSSYDDGNGVIVGANNLIQLPLDTPNMASIIGLTPEILKKNERVLGVTGTYEGSSGGNTSYGIYGYDDDYTDEDTGEFMRNFFFHLTNNDAKISDDFGGGLNDYDEPYIIIANDAGIGGILYRDFDDESGDYTGGVFDIPLAYNNSDNTYRVELYDVNDTSRTIPTGIVLFPKSAMCNGLYHIDLSAHQVNRELSIRFVPYSI